MYAENASYRVSVYSSLRSSNKAASKEAPGSKSVVLPGGDTWANPKSVGNWHTKFSKSLAALLAVAFASITVNPVYAESPSTVLQPVEQAQPFAATNPGATRDNRTDARNHEIAVRPINEPASYSIPASRTAKVSRGDTVASLLGDLNVARADVHAAIRALKEIHNPRNIQIGQALRSATVLQNGQPRLVNVEIESQFDRFAGVTRYPDGTFRPYELLKLWTKSATVIEGTVQTSLFADGLKEGATRAAMSKFLQLFSFEVDFQRDLRVGDKFRLVFEQYFNSAGAPIHSGDLLYAHLIAERVNQKFYRFGGKSGDGNYYDAAGRSQQKALLKTPIDGARLSSGFGVRRHPILGFNKMHKGVDFAAPRGTPIKAAGDGVVTFAGWQGGYGRFISIKHDQKYTTAYAHLSRFARSTRKGRRVKQGQIIGYVGSTGRSTGPHLHYEVRANGRAVNPRRLRLPSGKSISKKQMTAFKDQVAEIDALMSGSINAVAEAP